MIAFANGAAFTFTMESFTEISELERDFKNYLTSGSPAVGIYKLIHPSPQGSDRITVAFKNVNLIETHQRN